MDATTLPTLLLGGDPDGAPDETYAAWQAALRCRRSAAWWSAAPCSTRPTTTWPRRSTRPSRWSDEYGDRATAALPAGRHRPRATAYDVEVTPGVGGLGLLLACEIVSLRAGEHRRVRHRGRRGDRRAAVSGAVSVEVGRLPSRPRRAGRACSPGRPTSPTCRIGQTVDAAVRARAAGSRSAAPVPSRSLPLRYLPAAKVPVELRGAGQSSRQVRNFGTPDALRRPARSSPAR